MTRSLFGRFSGFARSHTKANEKLNRSRLTRPGRRQAFFESLEQRVVLATFAEAATFLHVDMNVANATLEISSAGTSYSLTLAGDTWSGPNTANVTGNGTATLTVTAAGLAALDTLNVTDSAAGIAVTFADSGANSYSDQFIVALDDPAASTITFLGSSTFVSPPWVSALSASTTQNILLSANSSLSAVNGNLTLEATQNITIDDGGQLVSDGGIDSHPFLTLSTNSISIAPLGSINSIAGSTIIQPKTAGTLIDVGGVDVIVGSPLTLGLTDAELDRVMSENLQIGDTTSSGLLTVSAPITHDQGLALYSSTDVLVNESITLVADQALSIIALGTVSLPNATSDLATSAGGTIHLYAERNLYVGNSVSLTSPDGAVVLHANLGEPTSGIFNGVTIDGASIAASHVDLFGFAGLDGGIGVNVIGSSITATNMYAFGFGGNSATGNAGLIISDSSIEAEEGAVTLHGYGGGPEFLGVGRGVGLDGSVISAMRVEVMGYGGGGAAGDNPGLTLFDSSLVAGDAGMKLQGWGGGPEGLAGGVGIGLYAGSEISSPSFGAIEMEGHGGIQTANHENHGIIVQGANSRIVAEYGSVQIGGFGGGSDTSERNYGVALEDGGQVLTPGEYSSQLSIFGMGGNWTGSGGSNYGLRVIGANSGIISNSFRTNVHGQGGGFGEGSTGGSNVGLLLADGAVISFTNSASDDSSIVGVGGGHSSTGEANYGIHVRDAASITGVGGVVQIAGSSSGSAGNDQTGLVLESAEISVSGIATLIVTGSGGGHAGGDDHVGVRIEGTNSRITSSDGPLIVQGYGGGSDTSSGNIGVMLRGGNEISASGSGPVIVDGNGGNTEGTGTGNFGVFIVDANSQVKATAADITIIADSMEWSAVANAVSTASGNRVTLRPRTEAFPIDLGGADVPGATLGLSEAELDSVTAGTIQFGDENSGTITITAAISRQASTNLELISGGSIIFNPGSLNTAGGTLRLTGGDVQPLSSGVDATTSAITALSFGTATDLKIVIDGTTIDTQYSQLKVLGLVDLTGVDLALVGSHTPVIGQSFVLIDNDGTGLGGDAVSGTFADLPEGALVLFNGEPMQITYQGGDGNDVALMVINAAPTIEDQSLSVAENSANNTAVGTVIGSDLNSSQSLTYAITAGNELGAFTINSSTGAITVADGAALDYESLTTFSLTISVTDSGTPPLTDSAVVTVDVVDVNEAPVIASASVVSVAENTTAVIDVDATDADAPPQTLQYSISGGVDAELFAINGATGVVSFIDAPDYELPADAGADNLYNIEITVSDGELSTTQALAIQVTDVGELDFGDAPDSYKTLLDADGARHLQSSLFLGASIDADANGQPTASANGDDNDLDGDDEDGVAMPATLYAGVNANLTVTASQAGKLDAWIDFNRNGTFEPGEKVFASVNVAAGVNALTIAVPANAIAGATYARFRLSTAGVLVPTGLASDGEVEDYSLQLSKPATLSAQLVADPQNPSQTLLLVNGSQNSDAIIVQPVPGSTTQLRVVFPGIILGPFARSAVNRIEIHAHGGSDSIVVDASISQPATIYAGDGNDAVVSGSGDDLIFGEAGIDSLMGGAGNDVLHGGSDADYLYGGVGNDVLIGGSGADWLFGDGGDDLLIGSNGPGTVADLLAIQAIWSTPQSLNQRALALASRVNPTTVTDDGVADYIYGSVGSDWQIDYQLRDYFFDYFASQDRKN